MVEVLKNGLFGNTTVLVRVLVYEFSGLLVNPSSSGVYKLGYSDPSTLELP